MSTFTFDQAQAAFDAASPHDESPDEDGYDAYLTRRLAELRGEYEEFLEHNDPCTWDEFLATVEPPQEFGDWLADLIEELRDDAAEHRAEVAAGR